MNTNDHYARLVAYIRRCAERPVMTSLELQGKLRLNRKTQSWLADTAGVNKATVSRWVNNKQPIGRASNQFLCVLFWLFREGAFEQETVADD